MARYLKKKVFGRIWGIDYRKGGWWVLDRDGNRNYAPFAFIYVEVRDEKGIKAVVHFATVGRFVLMWATLRKES